MNLRSVRCRLLILIGQTEKGWHRRGRPFLSQFTGLEQSSSTQNKESKDEKVIAHNQVAHQGFQADQCVYRGWNRCNHRVLGSIR